MGCRKLSYHEECHLKDHLGNVRLTFSTLPENYAVTETFETGEENGFQDLHRVTNATANATPGGNEVCLLRGGETGAMLFLSLDKGDTIDLEVKANYAGAPSGTSFLGTLHSALFNSFDAVYGSGTEGGVAGSSDEFNKALSGAGMSGKDGAGEAPRAFLNYIIFDREMDYVRAGFRQISVAARGVGVHETVSLTGIIAGREGYLLAYLSNENKEAVDVHFDDFTVYHGKTNVVSSQDYYPFGLAFNERQRLASMAQGYLYQGKERDALDPSVYDFHARQYDAALGRFSSMDPAGQFASPYSGMGNNPVMYVDPDGEWAFIALGAMVNLVSNVMQGNVTNFWQGLGYAAIGAASGLAGAGAGKLVANAVAGTVGGFVGGALTGAAGGLAGGFVSGAGNAWTGGASFSEGLGAGLKSGGYGALTGGVIGGLSGGVNAVKDGRRFFDGATVQDQVLADRQLPFVRQEGNMNCGPANCESISRKRGGDITQQSIRKAMPEKLSTEPLNAKQLAEKFSSKFGYKGIFDGTVIPPAEAQLHMKNGYDVTYLLRTGTPTGHAVTANRVTERVITKISGKVARRLLVDVMDPLAGQYVRVSNSSLANAHKAFLFFP